jgi:hypothetical protein
VAVARYVFQLGFHQQSTSRKTHPHSYIRQEVSNPYNTLASVGRCKSCSFPRRLPSPGSHLRRSSPPPHLLAAVSLRAGVSPAASPCRLLLVVAWGGKVLLHLHHCRLLVVVAWFPGSREPSGRRKSCSFPMPTVPNSHMCLSRSLPPTPNQSADSRRASCPVEDGRTVGEPCARLGVRSRTLLSGLVFHGQGPSGLSIQCGCAVGILLQTCHRALILGLRCCRGENRWLDAPASPQSSRPHQESLESGVSRLSNGCSFSSRFLAHWLLFSAVVVSLRLSELSLLRDYLFGEIPRSGAPETAPWSISRGYLLCYQWMGCRTVIVRNCRPPLPKLPLVCTSLGCPWFRNGRGWAGILHLVGLRALVENDRCAIGSSRLKDKCGAFRFFFFAFWELASTPHPRRRCCRLRYSFVDTRSRWRQFVFLSTIGKSREPCAWHHTDQLKRSGSPESLVPGSILTIMRRKIRHFKKFSLTWQPIFFQVHVSLPSEMLAAPRLTLTQIW